MQRVMQGTTACGCPEVPSSSDADASPLDKSQAFGVVAVTSSSSSLSRPEASSSEQYADSDDATV